jgi:hypothetical protein
MRRWLLLFLVLLLPLRGWVGEAMAGQMLQQRITQVQQVESAVRAHASHPGQHAHEGTHASGTAHAHHGFASSRDTVSAHGDCGTCAACQVCSSVALSPTVPTVPPGGFSQPRPETFQRDYTSAEALLAFKPPRG